MENEPDFKIIMRHGTAAVADIYREIDPRTYDHLVVFRCMEPGLYGVYDDLDDPEAGSFINQDIVEKVSHLAKNTGWNSKNIKAKQALVRVGNAIEYVEKARQDVSNAYQGELNFLSYLKERLEQVLDTPQSELTLETVTNDNFYRIIGSRVNQVKAEAKE